MAELNDIGSITIGGQAIGAAYIGGDMIWPMAAIVWELTPTWSVSLANAIAASGGSSTATWYLTGKQNGATVYGPTAVTPTSVTSISDSTNFHYNRTSGVWSADNRGTNGYTSSTTAPGSALNAPARDCTLVVNYTGTITVSGNSESVNVNSATQTMTQAANNGSYASAGDTYDQFTASLNRYNSQSSPAPASQSSATASASCRVGNYIEWASGSSAYYYQTISTNMFVFSSTASWITISDNTITAATRGTTQDNNARSATITAKLNPSYYPSVTTTTTTTMWQAKNIVTQTVASVTSVTSYSLDSVSSTINVYGNNTITLNGKWSGTVTPEYYVYSSGAETDHTPVGHTNEAHIPDSYRLYGSSTNVPGNTFSVSGDNKHSTSQKSYRVYGKYGGKESTSTITIYQDADVVKTDGKKDYAVSLTNIVNGLTAAGGNVTFTATATHTDYSYWQSDSTLISEQTGVADTPTISIDTSSSTAASASSRFTKYSSYVSHTSMTTNGGFDKVQIFVVHPSDSSNTASSSVLSSPENKLTGTITASASTLSIPASGASNITLSASCPQTWTSGSSGPTVTSGFTYTITTYGNSGKRTYTLDSSNSRISFGTLGMNEVSAATTVVTASYSGATSDTISFTEAKNEKYTDYGAWGTRTEYQSWSLSCSLAAYGPNMTPAPKGAGSTTLNISAYHEERFQQYRDIYYTWDSGYPRQTDEETGSWSSWGAVTDMNLVSANVDGAGFSIGNVSYQSGATSGTATVTISANGGNARNALITVTRAAHQAAQQPADSAYTHIYQKAGNVAISVNPTSLFFTGMGANHDGSGGPEIANFVVTATSSGWTMSTTYSTELDPFSGTTISPQTGTSGTTTVTVEYPIRPRAEWELPNKRKGKIIIMATEDDTVTAEVAVSQTIP